MKQGHVEQYESPQIKVSTEVSSALRRNEPVVALESTIIAHGMPFPQNLETADTLEQTVRANGATPATVAVLDGIPHVGLSKEQLHMLASPSSKMRKLAQRDLPLAYAQRQNGATTVSATMAISAAAGVPVFATGGIGGVHRGVADTWDVSADIRALASIPQLVVCAGAKSLLDVPKTLEALESASVPVVVLKHDKFPAFYTRGSLPAPATVESEVEAARVFHVARVVNCGVGGMLLAVPVPMEFEADAGVVEKAVQQALRELDLCKDDVRAAQVTPFLLRRVAEITDGVSLRTNIQLARNNAGVAARVSCVLCGLRARRVQKGMETGIHVQDDGVEVVVVGGVGIDITCDADRGVKLELGVSNLGRIRECVGGVGKNVSEAAARLGGARVKLISAVGDDGAGERVRDELRKMGIDSSGIRKFGGRRTAACCVVHDEMGDLAVAIGDMDDIFNSESESLVAEAREDICSALRTAKMACIDGNVSERDMVEFIDLCKQHRVCCWFEPTTPQKSVRMVRSGVLQDVGFLSPNEAELRAMGEELGASNRASSRELAEIVLREGGGGVRGQCLLLTKGALGVSRFRMQRQNKGWKIVETSFAARRVENLGNTTGAGDCFAGRCIGALAKGVEEEVAIRLGMMAAEECCRNDGNVVGISAKL